MIWGVNITGAEGGYIGGDKLFNSPEALAASSWDYIYPTIPEIDYFAFKGMTALRIPFLARRMAGANASRDIAILRGLIEHANVKSMTVLLDSHGAGPGDLSGLTGSGKVVGLTDAANQEFAAEWAAVAAAFKDEPNVIFGLLNEPWQPTAAQWLVAANMAIKAIRDAGATQTITVPGIHWTSGLHWLDDDNGATMLGVQDSLNNFVYEIHQYLDDAGSGEGPAVPGSGSADLVDVTTWARANGGQLFLGEYAFTADASDMTEGKVLQDYVTANSDVWIGATYWAAGPVWAPDYIFSVEPSGLPDYWTDDPFDPTKTIDKPQMAVLLA